jgi:hypothetical protein
MWGRWLYGGGLFLVALVPKPITRAVTLDTAPGWVSTTPPDSSVFHIECVSVDAVCFASIFREAANSAKDVYSWRYLFEVAGVYTCPVAAQVV